MAEDKLIVKKLKSHIVPVLQRCISCMSRSDFSLKIVYDVCSVRGSTSIPFLSSFSAEKTHKKFYCKSCILKSVKNNCIEKELCKYWEEIAKFLDVNVSPMEVASHPSQEVQIRRDRILDIIRHSPGKDINEIAEIYSLKHSSSIKSYLLRSDLVFLYKKSYVEKHKKKLYKYYPVAIIKSS